MPLKPFLNWLSREGYGSLAPIDKIQAESYLIDLWNKAPKLVFLSQFIGLSFIQLSPLFYFYRPHLFSNLTLTENDILQKKLSTSRWYMVRLLFYGVRAHALIAQFRKPLSISQPMRLAS
jgi:hypothetical protein